MLWTKASLLVSSFLTCQKPLTLSTMAYYLANCPNVVLCPPPFSGSSRIFPIDPSAQLLLEPSPNPCRLLLVYLKAQFLVPICSQCLSMIYPLSSHQIVPQLSLNADDTTIYAIGSAVDHITSTLSSALTKCHEWMTHNKLHLNLVKTKCMLIHSRRKSPPPLVLHLNDTRIEPVPSFKFLGCMINKHLTWDDHIALVTTKVSRSINLLRRMSWFLPKSAMMQFYNAYILPSFDYCDVVWNSCTWKQALCLERLQNYAGRVILKKQKSTSSTWIRDQLSWPSLQARRSTHISTQVLKACTILGPGYLSPLLQSCNTSHHSTRSSTLGNLQLPQPTSEFGKKAFAFFGPKTWNCLPTEAKLAQSLDTFTTHACTYFCNIN